MSLLRHPDSPAIMPVVMAKMLARKSVG